MQAEPNWTDMYEWARNMAWNMKPNNHWVKELASAAIAHLVEVWQQYRDLSDVDFRKTTSTIMYHEMLKVIADENSRGTHVTAKKADATEHVCYPKDKETEEEIVANFAADDRTSHRESQVDMQEIQTVAERILTPTERRVMRVVFRDPDISAAEIAAELGDMSEGAAKIQRYNAMKRLKSFFSNDIILFTSRTLR